MRLLANGRLVAFGCAVILSSAGACSSGGVPATSGGTSGAGGGVGGGPAVCSTFASPPKEQLPHVNAEGAKAAAVSSAFEAILAAQNPPVSTGSGSYTIPSLVCDDQTGPPPAFVDGYSCHFTVKVGSATPVTVDEAAPSQLAQNLFDALQAAGSSPCDDVAHGTFIRLQNVTVSAGGIGFDDTSSVSLTPTPNLVVHGADAKNVVDTFRAAGIDDCNPGRKLFLTCNTFSDASGAPKCGYSWDNLWKVGSSELVYTCNPQLPNGMDAQSEGGTLDAAHSLAIWSSILVAAKDAGFEPLHGTIEQTTIVNASYFGWDGVNLGLTLVADDATPPPFDAGGGGPSGPESPTP